jgi:hypothetical protein
MRRLALLSICSLAACTSGPPAEPTEGGPAVRFELLQPSFADLAPNHVELGKTVQVFGKDFIDPEHGALSLHLEGVFKSDEGASSRWVGDVPLTYVAPNQATFVFGPGVFFSPSGLETGSFEGNFQIVSTLATDAVNAERGDQRVSKAATSQIVALPSIYIEQMRAVGAPGGECDLVTSSTTAAQNIALGLRVIGAPPATVADPITFTVTYDPSELTVAYAADQVYSRWPFWGPSTPAANAIVPTTRTSFSMKIEDGSSLVIDPQHFEQKVTVDPPVVFNQQEATTVKLAGLASPMLPDTRPMVSTIYVRATRSDGVTVYKRAIELSVKNAIDFGVAPLLHPTEWQAPLLVDFVTGSVPFGTDENYHQSMQDSRQQSVSMTWNIQNQQTLGFMLTDQLKVSLGLPALASADNSVSLTASTSSAWTQAFGTDVSKSVTATIDQGSSVSQHVAPESFGAIYLQWLRLSADVDVTYHSACGRSGSIGRATLTSWKGGYLLETSNKTNPAPPDHASPMGPI